MVYKTKDEYICKENQDRLRSKILDLMRTTHKEWSYSTWSENLKLSRPTFVNFITGKKSAVFKTLAIIEEWLNKQEEAQ